MTPSSAEIQAICRDADKIADLLYQHPDLSRVITLRLHIDVMVHAVSRSERDDTSLLLEALTSERERIFRLR